jgi:ParB/RepB/Spo0J family partition protein
MAKSSDGIMGAVTSGVTSAGTRHVDKGKRVFGSGKKKPTRKPESISEAPSPTDSVDENGTLKYIPTELIESWEYKDRTFPELDDDPEFHTLMDRIRTAGGNIQPIKVRPNPKKPGHYQEIFGFKRLHACRRLGLPVLAIVEELDDQEAFRQMSSENDGRSEVAAWPKAISWVNALENNLVSSVEALALETGKDVKTIKSYLRVVEIMDDEIIDKVKMHQFGIQPLFEMRSALLEFENDQRKRQEFIDRIIEQADVIDAGRATPALIRSIANQVSGASKQAAGNEKTVKAGDGSKLFSVKKAKQGYSVKFHFSGSKELPPEELESIVREHLKAKGIEID